MTRLRGWPLFLLVIASGCSSASDLVPPSDRAPLLIPTAAEREMEKCLPGGVRLDTGFCADHVGGRPTTVLHKLRELGAWCRNGKVCDRWGRPLYFYEVPGWGPPPSNWDQICADEASRVRYLERHYRTIYMYASLPAC